MWTTTIGNTSGYTIGMAMTAKIAISIDKRLLAETNRIARKRKMSRSRVVAQAIEDLVRREHDDEITESLNKVYSMPPTKEDKKAMDFLHTAAWWTAKRNPW